MTPQDAETLARRLMAAHGVGDWAFGFNRRKRSLGLCYYERRRIELSRHYIARNDEASVRDTVLHEIAHALAGRRAGHGPAWKALCVKIGATPLRCDATAEMPAGRWVGQCPSCAKEFSRHRRPQRGARYSCKRCGPGKGSFIFTLAAFAPHARQAG
jgi:predicted SprT family Zn-dependent metalloprotease